MKKINWTALFAASGMLILILDTKTALQGAADGISLCLQTLIPSMFPFILLSKLLISALLGTNIPILGNICRLTRAPRGTASIFLVGALGGYPIGAQCISAAVKSGTISRENGSRMLPFCSNAGPAFLFGLGTRLFQNAWMCWVLWAVHILAALITGFLLPGGDDSMAEIKARRPVSLTTALKESVLSMSLICGWVVVFRILIGFCRRWFLWMLPVWAQHLIPGLLELSNGCCALAAISDVRIRFVLFSVFLGFGGLCVTMQTKSVCENIPMTGYFLGKVTQALISLLLSAAIVFSGARWVILAALSGFCILYYFCGRNLHKAVAFSRKQVYNKGKTYAR